MADRPRPSSEAVQEVLRWLLGRESEQFKRGGGGGGRTAPGKTTADAVQPPGGREADR